MPFFRHYSKEGCPVLASHPHPFHGGNMLPLSRCRSSKLRWSRSINPSSSHNSTRRPIPIRNDSARKAVIVLSEAMAPSKSRKTTRILILITERDRTRWSPVSSSSRANVQRAMTAPLFMSEAERERCGSCDVPLQLAPGEFLIQAVPIYLGPQRLAMLAVSNSGSSKQTRQPRRHGRGSVSYSFSFYISFHA